MTEAEWLACADPDPILAALGQKPSRRKFGLFACACCRTVFDWLVDNRSREAVGVIEAFADGGATETELKRASNRATRAAGVVGGPPARAVSWAADERPDSICCRRVADEAARAFGEKGTPEWVKARSHQTNLLRDIFGNPPHTVESIPSWLTPTVVLLARQMYESREFSAMPILADALQDAGCDDEDALAHCRGGSPHARGCWVLDAVLGEE